MANHSTQTPAGKSSKTKLTQPRDDAKQGAQQVPNKVDEAAEQTFPASDAPGGWAGKDIAPQDREDAQEKQS